MGSMQHVRIFICGGDCCRYDMGYRERRQLELGLCRERHEPLL